MMNNHKDYIEELIHSFEIRCGRAQSNYQDSGSESSYSTMCKYEKLIATLSRWKKSHEVITALAARIKTISKQELRCCSSKVLDILNVIVEAGNV